MSEYGVVVRAGSECMIRAHEGGVLAAPGGGRFLRRGPYDLIRPLSDPHRV